MAITAANAREMNARSQLARRVKAEALTPVVPNVPANALQSLSERIRLTLAEDLLRCVQLLSIRKVGHSLSALRAHAGVLDIVARTCKTVLGWSDTQASPLVNLQVLGEVKLSLPKGAQASITAAEHAPQLAQEQSMLNASPTDPPEATP